MTAILACMGDGVISTDIKGVIEYMNTAAEGLTGWELNEAKGLNIDCVFRIINADTDEKLESPVFAALEKGSAGGLEKQTALIHRDGTRSFVSASCSSIRHDDGRVSGVEIVFRDITRIKSESKEAEEKLTFAKDHYKTLLDNFPDMVWHSGLDKHCDYVNKNSLDLLGMTFEEAVGMGWIQNLHPEDGKRYWEIYSDAFDKKAPFEVEYRLRRYDGEYRWILGVGRPFHDAKGNFAGYIGVCKDITEGKQAETLIKESQTKHQSLLMNMHNGFGYFKIATDSDNNPTDFIYVEINDAFEQIVGMKRKDVIGKRFLEMFPGNEGLLESLYNDFKKVALYGESVKINDFNTRKSGRWLSLYAFSSCKGYLALVINDVTSQKTAAEDMKKAKEAAETANRAKSEFLANMSHEIRTPLNGMLGMIDLTLLSDLSFEQKDNLVTAKSCANSLLKIINDILDFSKMEAGKLVIENINYDIKGLINDTIKAHSHRAVGKGLELSYTFASTIPQFLVGDPNRLQQVLNNLISNAMKFTENGDIAISVRKIASDDKKVELRFAVADTGIGIAHDEMDMLFKSFSQVDSSFTRKFGGTGLGLVISRQLVEMMGGTMWVESEKGRGSTFYFTIRCKNGSQMTEKLKEQPTIYMADDILHVLLVEDDNINRTVITRILKEKGHSIDTACNGIEAVEMYEHGRYDVILMDIQMPEMDGIEATKRIRQKETYSHTPIIALTAYALHGDKERFMSMGMDEYIAKPISMDELFLMLDRVSALKYVWERGRINIGKTGESQSENCKKANLTEEQLPVLEEISDCIRELASVMEENNLLVIEKIAHRIKSLANRIEADELKSAAFKIELAARRGNISDTIDSSIQISHEFETFKKSIS